MPIQKLAKYDDVMGYIRRFTDYERMVKVAPLPPYGITRMAGLLTSLGNPERKLRAIHIAGTKGKGSTAAMVASILRSARLKAGLYTSPHLVDVRERIMVNGEWITEEEVVDFANQMAPYLNQALVNGETYAPTFFEIFTAMTYLHFVKQEVDYAVLEPGLGGRLDATNVCLPVVCGITAIGYDHTDKLGDTLDCIAWEKAGIIKKGVPVVTSPQDQLAMNSIFAAAEGRGCRLITVGKDIIVSNPMSGRDGNRFSIETWQSKYEDLYVPLLGEHQATNAATAVGLIEVLREQGAAITEKHVRDGLATLSWHGRIDIVSEKPWVIIDSAHTIASAKALCKVLSDAIPCQRRVFLVGIAKDKDVDGVLKTLAPVADEMIFTKTNSPRSSEPADLSDKMREIAAIPTTIEPDIAKAIDRALSKAGEQDLVCVTGSFYLAGDVKLRLESKQKQKKAL